MKLDITDIAAKSFTTLYENKTVGILALAYAVIAVIFIAALLNLLNLPLSVLNYNFNRSSLVSSYTLPSLSVVPSFILLFIVYFLIVLFMNGLIVAAVGAGPKADISTLISKVENKYLTLLAADILFTILVLVLFAIMFIPIGAVIFAASTTPSLGSIALGGVVAILFAIVVGIALCYVAVKLIVWLPEILLGNKGAVDSFRASWNETRGNFLSIVVIFILVLVGVYVIGIFGKLLGFPVGYFIQSIAGAVEIIAMPLIYKGLTKKK